MQKIYKAKWILPGNEKIIQNGAILVENGKILEVFNRDELENISCNEITDYGNAVITSGFINLHTHLQFTDLQKPQNNLNRNFSGWILELIKQYASLTPEQKINSLKNGLKEAVLSGTTCVAQISREEEFLDVFNSAEIKSYIFLETFSNCEESSFAEFKKLKEKFKRMEQNKALNVNLGVSPHSVYNVHPVLWKKISDFACSNNILVHTHLAESLDEMDWLKNGFSNIDLIHKFVGWQKVSPFETGLNPVQYLKKLDILRPLGKNLIAAHLNQLEGDSIYEFAEYGANIALCPRSNLFLSANAHHRSTLEGLEACECGLATGLGTDSKFSNYDLNILNEAKYIKSGFNLLKLLDMLTINSAKILKLDHKIGSLEKGKDVDFLVFKLEQDESYLDLLDKERPDEVYISGNQVVDNFNLSMSDDFKPDN